jgi:hypothetical protein
VRKVWTPIQAYNSKSNNFSKFSYHKMNICAVHTHPLSQAMTNPWTITANYTYMITCIPNWRTNFGSHHEVSTKNITIRHWTRSCDIPPTSHPENFCLYKLNLNIILPSYPRSCKMSFSNKFTQKILFALVVSYILSTCRAHRRPADLVTVINLSASLVNYIVLHCVIS